MPTHTPRLTPSRLQKQPGRLSRRLRRPGSQKSYTLNLKFGEPPLKFLDAGVNAKALAAYMGHSSVTITLDRYGHLMPGAEDEAAERLDAYLTKESVR